MNRVRDKVAIVTGGASGMGRADAVLLAEEGARVVITDLNEADGQAVAESIGDAALFLRHDVTDEAGWEDVADEVWVVIAPPELAIERAMARDGVDAETVQKRIDAQLTNEERASRAHHVFVNDGELSALESALAEQHSRITAR